MAISKVILNGETLMDVTSDTAEAGKMLSGITATKNDGTKVTGNIATKSSTDLTASGATVTAPAGYYSSNASKAVASGSAKTPATTITANPTVSIDSDGLITATVSGSKSVTPTVSAGYISSGTAGTVSVSGTGTKQLTTKAASTINTSTSDRSIAAGTYLTGKQTIKGVTTSNLTAANIKSGTVVKVGDANSTTRIANVTGTFSSSSTVSSGQTAAGSGQILSGYSAFVDGGEIKGNIASKSSSDLTANGATVTAPAGYYANSASKAVSTTTHPNPTASIDNATGIVTASHTQTAGYVTSGTTTGALNLTTQGAQTITPSTSDKTIAANRWLTGIQTIKGDSNLIAANIAEGVSIFGIDGSHKGSPTHTATITTAGKYDTRGELYNLVEYNNVKYYSAGENFEFSEGENLLIRIWVYSSDHAGVYINGEEVLQGDNTAHHNFSYTLPNYDINIDLCTPASNYITINVPTIEITNSGVYDVSEYMCANVISNVVFGSFIAEKPSSGNDQVIDIPYTGTGHPILACVEVDGGFTNSDNTEWYDGTDCGKNFNRAVGFWMASKFNVNEEPAYTGSSIADKGAILAYYASKFNGHTETNMVNVSASDEGKTMCSSMAQKTNACTVCAFKNAVQLIVDIISNSDGTYYGLLNGARYRYVVVYSE